MADNDANVKTGRFFSAILEEYRIRLDAIERGRARSVGMLPLLSLAALGVAAWFFSVSGPFNGATAVMLAAMGVYAVAAVLLITAGYHKGLMRADVNALLKAAKLEDSEASEAMADIYIDRINDLDRMVERQESHFRSGAWLSFAWAALALLGILLKAII